MKNGGVYILEAPTKASREKIAASKRNDHKYKIGKKASDATKAKMSMSQKGRKWTPDAIAKRTATRKINKEKRV